MSEIVRPEGYLIAALRGLAEGMPSVEAAVETASKGAAAGAPERIEGLVEQVLSSAGRGEPSRTRAIAALPPEQVTAAVREGAARLGEADRERITSAAADLAADPSGERAEAFLDAASQVLADAPSVRHTLLTYAQVHLGRGKPLPAGERIGSRFEVIEFLGEGGTGAVYRVLDHRRGKEVALKLLSRSLVESPPARERFRKEVNLALDLTHPNVIRVYDMDEVDGQPFLHMELIEGDTLRALVAEGPLPFDRVLGIARGFLGALAYAHSKGVLHLDVKPENILLGKDGQVKLADFGLARAMGAEGMRTMMAGAGTPYYMSPEQLKGEGGLDARADVFAAGAVLYEMLVGDPPIGVFEPIPETVPAGVRAAVQQALSHRKEKRPRDAGELLAMLDAPAASIPVARLAEEPPRRTARRAPRRTSPFRLNRHERPPAARRGLVAIGRNEAGLEVFENSIGMRLVRLSPSEFRMGSDDGEEDERPAHLVSLTRPFFMGEAPVTQAQYEAVMGTCACRFRGPNLPVENVSWGGALLFLRALGRREGILYGLPSEAEWEYACRAGTQTRWFWGSDPLLADDHAWVADNSGGCTHDVRGKRPNPWGFYDMIGNVGEWCADWYDEEEYARCSPALIDPEGPSTGANRVVRGGSWRSLLQDLGSATREMEMPTARNGQVGFRVAMPAT
ncbi:MAG: bifunctional serine/threonine-protein kinase/formylglycine-generating enzyme family protein [Planctomycetota bacterium]